jgi:hypothetical protein
MMKMKEEDKREDKLKRTEDEIRKVQTSYTTLYKQRSERSFNLETGGTFYF